MDTPWAMSASYSLRMVIIPNGTSLKQFTIHKAFMKQKITVFKTQIAAHFKVGVE